MPLFCRYFVTARKRSLGQGNIFAPVCRSVHRGESTWAGTPLGRYTPWQVHPGRYTPWQIHPPGRYTPSPPPWAGTPPPPAGTSPRQVHPREGTPPRNACWDTVNKRAVRILLECILVINNIFDTDCE